jgi:AbrB family looped-hinge helix DNA binding protein
MIVTVSEKGQVVIPAEIRRLLGITPGTRLEVVPDDGGLKMLLDNARKTRSASDCIGIAGYAGPALTNGQLDVAPYARKS